MEADEELEEDELVEAEELGGVVELEVVEVGGWVIEDVKVEMGPVEELVVGEPVGESTRK